jgi:hypothetical protein
MCYCLFSHNLYRKRDMIEFLKRFCSYNKNNLKRYKILKSKTQTKNKTLQKLGG